MATAPTLVDQALPASSRLVPSSLLIVAGSALCAVASHVSVPLPFTPVPVNGLTFAVLLLGAVLGWRRGAAAVLLFLAEGAAGLPVFAPTELPKTNWQILCGPTAGFLIAAPLAAALIGYLAQRRWDRNAVSLLAALLLADAVMFAGGLAWLSRLPLTTTVWRAGLLPFVPGEAVKIALVMLMLPGAWYVLGTAQRELTDPRD